MKLSIILIILISHFSYSQGYKEQFKTDVCQCIESEKADTTSLNITFNKCFKKHITKYASLIDSEIKEDNKTQKYAKGQKARLALLQKFKYELVHSCNYYFNTINNARQLILQKLRETPLDSSELERHNQNIAMKPHWQNYYARANVYFKLGDLKKAEQDLRASLETNPYDKMPLYVRKEKLLLAWVLEEQNRFTEAIAIYDEINIGKADNDTEILKAIVKKRNGLEHNTNTKFLKQPTKENTKNKASNVKDSSISLKNLFKLKQ